MLSNDNIRRINQQIERELRKVDSILIDDEEKDAALDRIAKLTTLLNPQPTREDILTELASALVDARDETSDRHSQDVLVDLGSVIRSFYRK